MSRDVEFKTKLKSDNLYRPDKTKEEMIAEAKAHNQAVREEREQEGIEKEND